MKKASVLFLIIAMALTSCSIFKRKEKYGCPTDGRNVGAEQLASGDAKAIKASKKAKFKGTRSY